MRSITAQEAEHWLDLYKNAWEDLDPELAASLYAPDCTYLETPDGEPMRGRDGVRTYWRDKVLARQSGPQFDYQLWTTCRSEAYADWRARFFWLPESRTLRLDGVMRLIFSDRAGGHLLCQTFLEWFRIRGGG